MHVARQNGKLRLRELQADMRFKFPDLVSAFKRINAKLSLWGKKGSVKETQREAASLTAMLTDVWKGLKSMAGWTIELGFQEDTESSAPIQAALKDRETYADS